MMPECTVMRDPAIHSAFGRPAGHIMEPPRKSLFPRERLIGALTGIVYLFVFRSVYYTYISVEWGYTGLWYRPLSILETVFIYFSTALVSWFLPTKLEKPSTIILWFLYAIAFMPTIAITFMIGALPSIYYASSLLAFAGGIILISRILDRGNYYFRQSSGMFSRQLCNIVLVMFVISSIVIFYVYRSILQFASIDDVYVQRFAAADFTGGAIGYIRSYNGYLLTPLVMAIGLCDSSRRSYIFLGMSGFLLSYMVDASKISLVIPIIMIVAALVFRLHWLRTFHMTGGLIILCLTSVAFTGSVRLVRFIADLVLLRTIAIPGQTFAQYFDVFYVKGYTWWSNVTGISKIVPPPAAFQHDRFWPVLGQIVGAEYYGAEGRTNLNANAFVGEGIAAAGPIGVVIISLAMALFLRAIDRSSALWNLRVLMVLMVPIGLALTNVHLSTYLVSFGGVAWILLFRCVQPMADPIQPTAERDGASSRQWVSPVGKDG